MAIDMTAPIPFFRHRDRVLYLGDDPPYLFAAPERELVACFLGEDRAEDHPIVTETETIDTTSTRVRTTETITTVTHTTISIQRTPNVEAADLEDLVALGGQPHPYGLLTTVRSLAEAEARADLAAAQAVAEGASEELDRALALWAEYCDAVTEALADGASVDDVLKAAWPRRATRRESSGRSDGR